MARTLPSYAVLGEDASDASTVKVLIRRIAKTPSLPISPKGFDGAGDLLKKGARQIQEYRRRGIVKFIVVYDADGPDPDQCRHRAIEQILAPAGIEDEGIAVIPVQELESWILADIESVTRVITSWTPNSIAHPESIESPKDVIESLSRNARKRQRYFHREHNEKVAEHLRLDVVAKKCRSFRPLVEFVRRDFPDADTSVS